MAAAKAFATIDERLHHLFLPQIETLDMVPKAQRCGVVSRMRPGHGSGSAWMTGVGGECLVTVLDLSVEGTADLTSHSPGYFCVGAMSRSSLDTMPLPVSPAPPSGLVMYRQEAGAYPYQLKPRTPYVSRSVCFTPRLLERLAHERGQDTEAFLEKLTEGAQTVSSPQLELMLDRLDVQAADSAAMGFHVTALMAEAVACLLEAAEGSMAADRACGSRAAARLVKDARDVMMRHLDEPLTLEGIARQLCVSRAHLAAIYKKETGVGVAADLRRMRMEKAARLLAETDLPLAEVARSVGYARQSSFTTAFKDAYALSPAQWRKR